MEGSGARRIDIREGIEELNLVEFPLAVLSDHVPNGQKTLLFEDAITDDANGDRVCRRVTISAPDSLRLPNWKDQDVLLALMALANEKNRFQEAVLGFSLYEVRKVLGLDDCGETYRRLAASLDRWNGLWVKLENAFRRGTRWTTEGFHVIERYKLTRGRDYAPEEEQRLIWNSAVIESVAAKYTKGLDLGFYLGLSPTSKRLYRFLDKRFGLRQCWEFDLLKLCHEKLGMSRNYEAWRCREKLKVAISELEGKGFLTLLPGSERFLKQAKGNYRVCFTVDRASGESSGSSRGRSRRVGASDEVKAELVARGIHPDAASRFAAELPREKIRSLIEYTDAEVKKKPGRVTDPTRFLAAALHRAYDLPKGFQTEAQRQAKALERQERERREREREQAARGEQARRDAETRGRVDRYMASLSQRERDALVEAAVAQAPTFTRSLYQRRKRSEPSSALTAEILQSMVDSFVLTVLSKDSGPKV